MNFYDSIIEGAQELTVAERGQLYAACLEYLYFDGRMPDFDMKPAVKALFVSHKVSFDRQLARKRAGRSGGMAKAHGAGRAKQTSSKPQEDAKQTPSKPPSKTLANAKQTPSRPQGQAVANTQAKLWQTPSEQEQEQEIEKPPTDVGGKKSAPKRKQRPFVAPTVGQVADEARRRNLTLVDPEAFWAHYDAQGWVNGNGVPLVSWESKLISWNSAERLRQQEQQRGGAYDATYD